MKEYDLKEFLERYKNTNIDFYRFPGNYGDSVIFHGTMILLKKLKISPDFIELDSEKINDILFIDGGGNFVDYYSDVKTFLLKNSNNYKEIVILPHTIFGQDQIDLINNIKTKITIFCREKISAELLTKQVKNHEIYLWHDCAFYYDFEKVKKDIKYESKILNTFREDVESENKIVPENNQDISKIGWAKMPLDDFINTINENHTINTDRLHVAIASTLLGKNVKFYSNSYFKNKAVYEYSLKKYSNIIFVDGNKISFNINKIFISFFNNVDIEINESEFDSLIYECISTNKKLWDLEDLVRKREIGYEHIAKTKFEIDITNQIRNECIYKIDKFISKKFSNKKTYYQKNTEIETPGMIIDRMSIIFIKIKNTKNIIGSYNNKRLKREYERKLNYLLAQLDSMGSYLDLFISDIKNQKRYFKIYNPVKIYNDKRLR